MRKRKPRFNLDPETGELVEIDEELSAAIEEAVAQVDRGETIPLEVLLKRWERESRQRAAGGPADEPSALR